MRLTHCRQSSCSVQCPLLSLRPCSHESAKNTSRMYHVAASSELSACCAIVSYSGGQWQKSRLLDTVCLMVPNTSRHALPVPVRPRQSRFHQMRLSPPCAPLDYLRIPSLAARKLTPFPFALVAKLVHANVNMGISVARGGMDEVASITHHTRTAKLKGRSDINVCGKARAGRADGVESGSSGRKGARVQGLWTR